jgi:transcriptional antiterminator NusG
MGAGVIDELDNAIGQTHSEGAAVPPMTPPAEEPQHQAMSGDDEAGAQGESAEIAAGSEVGSSETPPPGEAPDVSAEAPSEPTVQPSEESPPEPAPAAPNGRMVAATEPVEDEEIRKEWYILKVQSNREESIKEGLMRRVRAAGLDRYFGECIVPTEMVSEFKGGKKRVTKRKLYPGYLVVHMAINDDTWYLVRETTGIGDFTGSVGRPTPMLAQDVQKILAKTEEKTDEAPKLKIKFKKGDRVKINEGTFENFEGDVDTIDEGNGRVSVMINIFGRSTPVELEYWQIEAL